MNDLKEKLFREAFKREYDCGYVSGCKSTYEHMLINVKELINELGEEQGLKALRDWLKHELKSMGDEK